jgi:ABC-type proline/glycine betaine transport system permease subunit
MAALIQVLGNKQFALEFQESLMALCESISLCLIVFWNSWESELKTWTLMSFCISNRSCRGFGLCCCKGNRAAVFLF